MLKISAVRTPGVISPLAMIAPSLNGIAAVVTGHKVLKFPPDIIVFDTVLYINIF